MYVCMYVYQFPVTRNLMIKFFKCDYIKLCLSCFLLQCGSQRIINWTKHFTIFSLITYLLICVNELSMLKCVFLRKVLVFADYEITDSNVAIRVMCEIINFYFASLCSL